MHDYNRYLLLAEKWKMGTITPEEQQELDSWYAKDQDRSVEIPDTLAASEELHEERILKGIYEKIDKHISAKRVQLWRWISAAAIIIIIGVAGVAYYSSDKEVDAPLATLEQIQPGSNRATLTLSDGKKIELTGQESIVDGEIKIKNENNGLIYSASNGLAYNTMTTPKGGTYRLRLPDGTSVWLNAASSITYPTAFTGNTRTVQLTGEAYFEVAKNKLKPFIVDAGNERVQVLGTEFNINTYVNEPAMQTTLIEGSVKIGEKLLKPGEAWINGTVRKVNTAAVIAWKSGLFQFEEADLKAVMRQIERWYNIEVRYEGKLPKDKFEGELKRSLNLAQIMKLLSYMNIHYRLENNRDLIISGK